MSTDTRELVELTHITDEKAADLLAIKKRLNLPDPRHDFKECALCDLPDIPGSSASTARGATRFTMSSHQSFSNARKVAIYTIAKAPLILICRCGIRRRALVTATGD